MEDYLENMKRLRSHMDEIEEEAAKRSVEEQRQRTAIRSLEDDLKLVTAEKKRLNEDSEEMVKEKGHVLLVIAEKQKKISALEIESSTLSQTLELLHQEIASELSKFNKKRSFYTKSLEELNAKLQIWQDWLNTYRKKMLASAPSVDEAPSKQILFDGTTCGVDTPEGDMDKMEHVMSEREKGLTNQILSSREKVEELEAKRSEVLSTRSKNKELIEQLRCKIKGVPPALVHMDLKALEEEHKALLSDKAGEAEYYQSLQDRVNAIKSISDTVRCQCGFEYRVEFVDEAMNCS